MSQWLFSNGTTTVTSPEKEIQKEVDQCKNGVYMLLNHIVKSEAFVPDPAIPNSCSGLTNHSTKKYARTHGRSRSMHKDFMDYQAHWWSKRIQETYTDTVLPWADIKTALVSCFGGKCKYKLKESVNIFHEWLTDHVLPWNATMLWHKCDNHFSKVIVVGMH